jgi:hypothetical protein
MAFAEILAVLAFGTTRGFCKVCFGFNQICRVSARLAIAALHHRKAVDILPTGHLSVFVWAERFHGILLVALRQLSVN